MYRIVFELFLPALVFPAVVMAGDIDCTMATCQFGSLVDTMTSTEIVNVDNVSLTGSTITNVYLDHGVFTYLFTITESAIVPVEIPSVLVTSNSFHPMIPGLLNWGVMSDLISPGMNDCGDTNGAGCETGTGWGWSPPSGGTGEVMNGEGWQSGLSSIGTGISSSPANSISTSNTFAFYLQSLGPPQPGAAGASFLPNGAPGPGEPLEMATLVPETVPEPGTWLMVALAVMGVATKLRLSEDKLGRGFL
jgi:hypothetical protein